MLILTLCTSLCNLIAKVVSANTCNCEDVTSIVFDMVTMVCIAVMIMIHVQFWPQNKSETPDQPAPAAPDGATSNSNVVRYIN